MIKKLLLFLGFSICLFTNCVVEQKDIFDVILNNDVNAVCAYVQAKPKIDLKTKEKLLDLCKSSDKYKSSGTLFDFIKWGSLLSWPVAEYFLKYKLYNGCWEHLSSFGKLEFFLKLDIYCSKVLTRGCVLASILCYLTKMKTKNKRSAQAIESILRSIEVEN